MIVFKPNKKGAVKNATKVIDCGIKFDSKLEHYFWKLLKSNGIEFTMKTTYTIQPSFRYLGEAIRPIQIIPDFILPKHNIIVDTKGFQTSESKLKWKVFKKYLYDNGMNYKAVLLKNQRECREFIEKIFGSLK